MRADLDTAAKSLKNTGVITYTNNSPDLLPSLWLYFEQNTYRKDSRSRLMGGGRGGRGGAAPSTPQETTTDGIVFDSVEIEAGKKTEMAEYIVSDTRMQIRLAEPLKPHGGQLKIRIACRYKIPGTWGGRKSWGMSQKGEIYDTAQWYPIFGCEAKAAADILRYSGTGLESRHECFDPFVPRRARRRHTGPAEHRPARSGRFCPESES